MRILDARVNVCCPGRNFVTLKIVTEDGETKLYDKVAQTDTDQAGEETTDDTPREQPKAAPAEDAPVAKKPVRVGVAAYAAETTSTTTVVTA